ncbi:hypothetical protein [Caproiciproducens sp. MSJ-32]|uniref:hypothetical protein n=1 Tax=Caproiciproducens sp. MSJ-32 TaxID=2841527 RepID=UPI001C10F4EE|nr:hypothetical protein [Caproiciproducens sp. MSJ-32]MBU5453875.1 hypothetical protein [Caproiciproducens sp. MSJ-32]
MIKILMIILLFTTVKVLLGYLVSRLKSSKKRTISAEEVIQFKGLTKERYEKVVAPIMWDNKNYYEQLKFNMFDSEINTPYIQIIENNKPCNNAKIEYKKKKSNVIPIQDYYKGIEEEYNSLKELFKEKHSDIS